MGINRNLLHGRPAEIGRVKVGFKGGKRKGSGGSEYYLPQKFENENGPYFVITKMVRDKTGAENFVEDTVLMEKLAPFADKIDGKLRQIPITVRSDIVGEVAPTRFNKYKGTNLFCFGEGKGEGDATRIVEGKRTKVTCPCHFLEMEGDERCKPNMIFRFTIVAGDETKIGVYHSFRTTGWNSINGTIGGLEDTLEAVGTLSLIKLWMCVKWDYKKDRNGKTRRVVVAYVECRVKNIDELQSLQRLSIERRKLHLAVVQAGNPVRLGLPAPGDESKEEQAEIAAEWYPTSGETTESTRYADGGDEDDDEAFYDPKTGEVYEDGAEDGTKSEPEPQSKRGTDPAMPITDPLYTTAKPNEQWPSDHPARKRVAAMIKRLAFLRDVPDPKGQEAMISVLSEVTLRVLDKDVPFGALTIMQASLVDASMLEEIRRREAEDAEDAKAADVKQEDLWIPD